MSLLKQITVILCRPEGSRNVGAVCRAMKNSGLSKLAIIGNKSNFDISQIEEMAVHAKEIFQQASFSESLEDSLNGFVISAGFTRRRGSERKSYSHLPEELVNRIKQIKHGEIALVFGNEKHGLSDDELKLCDMAVHIPTDPDFPSINLSHSVQIISYLLYRESETKIGAFTPVNRDQLNNMIGKVTRSLESVDYFYKTDKTETELFLRDIFSRTLLSKRESIQIIKMFEKIRYMSIRKQR